MFSQEKNGHQIGHLDEHIKEEEEEKEEEKKEDNKEEENKEIEKIDHTLKVNVAWIKILECHVHHYLVHENTHIDMLTYIRKMGYRAHHIEINKNKTKNKEDQNDIISSGLHLVRLNHSFIRVFDTVQKKIAIIDTHFLEQFEIPRPTERYTKVLKSVPPVFIGYTHDLSLFLLLICKEMRKNFASNDLELPPWRQLKSYILRWDLSK